MTPVLTDENQSKPLRFVISQGSVVIMDGPSRMEWSHGLPYNVPFKKTKYTLMFKCDKFSQQNIIYNKKLDTQIISSGIIC